jgi:GcrA cell cycle regulator
MKTRNTMSSGGGGGAIQGATALKMDEEFAVEMVMAPQAQELFIPVEQRLTLLQLSEHTCKWPIGDPLTPDFYFCGQHSDDGKPYCDFHSRRAYHQVDKKRR